MPGQGFNVFLEMRRLVSSVSLTPRHGFWVILMGGQLAIKSYSMFEGPFQIESHELPARIC